MKTFIASNGGGRTIRIMAISASKAISTAAKIFNVKLNKISVKQV